MFVEISVLTLTRAELKKYARWATTASFRWGGGKAKTWGQDELEAHGVKIYSDLSHHPYHSHLPAAKGLKKSNVRTRTLWDIFISNLNQSSELSQSFPAVIKLIYLYSLFAEMMQKDFTIVLLQYLLFYFYINNLCQ